jgi:hypothetical protein
MYCPKCGAQNVDNAVYCGKCGTSLGTSPQPAVVVQRKTNGLAIAALILGILGFSILAIIFGAIALNQIKRDPTYNGKGMAVAGLVLGIVALAVELIILIVIIVGVTTAFAVI